jgi:hypothetical protein
MLGFVGHTKGFPPSGIVCLDAEAAGGVLKWDRSKMNRVPVIEGLRRDLYAVDESAVGRCEINNQVLRSRLMQLGVMSRHRGVINNKIVVVCPPDR